MRRAFAPLAILLILACAPAQQTPSTENPAPAGPKAGGTYNMRVPEDPNDWDLSYTGKSTPSGWGMPLAYSSLLAYKSGQDVPFEEQTLVPALAERWQLSPDATTFTFTLRKGIKFAPQAPLNGRDLTSADVKWTYEYWSRTGQFKDKGLPVGQFAWMFQGLEGIDTPDQQTAVIRFEHPFAPFLNYTGSNYNPVVAREIFEADGHLKDRILGSGPWQLDPASSQKGTRWIWKKNPNYWDTGKPYIDEIRWLTIKDNSAALAAFQTKQVDHLDRTALNFRAVEEIKRAQPQVEVMKYYQPFGNHIFMNNQMKPMDDARIRRALSLAIDRDELARADTGEQAPWALPGAIYGLFSDAEIRQMMKYDPEGARKLLAEAGYPNGIDIPWEFPGQIYGQGYVSRLELLQAQFKRAGINLLLKSMEQTEYISRRRNGQSPVSLASVYCGTSDDIDAHIYACYHSKSRQSYMFINDPEMDRLLEAQRRETDATRRREVLRDAVKRLHEMGYGVSTYYPPQYEAWHPYFKGYKANLSGWFGGSRLDNAWLDK